MLLTQEVKNGVALIQLHLDPERKKDPFSGLPRAATLRARTGSQPEAETARLRWTSADTLAALIPLHGSQTALTTVTVPGQGPVALPPVCLPYSPEYRPPEPGEGLVALQRLARATSGKERVELAGVWKELPRQARLIEVGHWLLLGGVVLLLIEVLERRSGVISGWNWRSRTDDKEPGRARRWFRRNQPAQPAASAESTESDKVAEALPPPRPSEQQGGLLDALRQARQRTRRPEDGTQ
jgi:hypothetical protein